MKKKQARAEAQARYDAINITRITIRLSPDNDADVIKKLASVSSKSGYIKGLIAKDIGIPDHYSAFITDTAPAAAITKPFFCIALHNINERHIIEKLKSVYTGRADYIRTLVREDIKNISRRPWNEIGIKINLGIYQDSAIYSAEQFTALANLLDELGCADKSDECRNISNILTTWVNQTKQYRKE